jgi:hypothetical protein
VALSICRERILVFIRVSSNVRFETVGITTLFVFLGLLFEKFADFRTL